MTPPEPAVKALTLLSRVMPKAKLVPQKDLSELVFRDLKKKKMVCLHLLSFIYDSNLHRFYCSICSFILGHGWDVGRAYLVHYLTSFLSFVLSYVLNSGRFGNP